MNIEPNYRNNRFNQSMHSLEWKLEGCDSSKASFISDCGAGAERIFDAIDYDRASAEAEEQMEAERRARAIDEAKIALANQGYAYLIETLELIIENRGDRGASIRALMKNGRSKTSARRLYERHREALMKFFHVA